MRGTGGAFSGVGGKSGSSVVIVASWRMLASISIRVMSVDAVFRQARIFCAPYKVGSTASAAMATAKPRARGGEIAAIPMAAAKAKAMVAWNPRSTRNCPRGSAARATSTSPRSVRPGMWFFLRP